MNYSLNGLEGKSHLIKKAPAIRNTTATQTERVMYFHSTGFGGHSSPLKPQRGSAGGGRPFTQGI